MDLIVLQGQTFTPESGITSITGGKLQYGHWEAEQISTSGGNFGTDSITNQSIDLTPYTTITIVGQSYESHTGNGGNHQSAFQIYNGTATALYSSPWHNGTININETIDISSYTGSYQLRLYDYNHNNGGTARVTSGILLTSIILSNKTVSITINPTGAGTVTGAGNYKSGDSVTIEATPNGGYRFEKFALNGYTKLDYIESSGTQYIDTGYVFNTNCEYNIKLSFTSIPNDLYAYGLYSPHTSLQNYGSSFMTSFGGQDITFTSEIGAITTNTIYEITRNSSSATVNGVTKTGTSGTISTSKTFWLFRANSLAQSYAGNQKLYLFKLYDNGALVRDFIPVKRTSDAAIGLLDLVNLKFYGNDGTGIFSYGSEVGEIELPTYTELEFIQSNGTQYIDTDLHIPYANIGYYLDFTWLNSVSSSGKSAFGVRDTSASVYNVILSYTGDTYTQNGYSYTSWAT